MRSTRKIVALGALGAAASPTAIALADSPASPAAATPDNVVQLHAHLAGTPTVRSQMRGAQHDRLLRTYRRVADQPDAQARFWSNDQLRREIARLRAARRAAATGASTTATGGGAGGQLAAIRACESGGNYSTDTGNGFYGAYQFTQQSWQAVGGTGNPAAASPAEQDRRAAMLMAQSGTGNWPVCGA
jgi:hypothetical protein